MENLETLSKDELIDIFLKEQGQFHELEEKAKTAEERPIKIVCR